MPSVDLRVTHSRSLVLFSLPCVAITSRRDLCEARLGIHEVPSDWYTLLAVAPQGYVTSIALVASKTPQHRLRHTQLSGRSTLQRPRLHGLTVELRIHADLKHLTANTRSPSLWQIKRSRLALVQCGARKAQPLRVLNANCRPRMHAPPGRRRIATPSPLVCLLAEAPLGHLSQHRAAVCVLRLTMPTQSTLHLPPALT